MSILMGRKAGRVYLMDIEDKSFRGFDINGAAFSRTGSLNICKDWVEVDVVSIITKTSSCEIFFKGDIFLVESSIQDCVKQLIGYGKHIGLTLFDKFEGYTQILLCYPLDTVNTGTFKTILDS